MKDEQPILIAIDEPNALEKNENDVEIHIVSVASDGTEHLTFGQQTTGERSVEILKDKTHDTKM